MKALFAAVALAFAFSAQAGDKGTPDEAVAMVKRAAAAIKANKEKAFAAIADPSNKDYHDRDLYVFVYDLNGVTLTHGNNPKMVGKPLLEMTDADGKKLIRAMVDLAKSPAGKGWVDYKWPNPVSKAIEPKSAYIERVDDMLVGSGAYK